MAEGVGLPRPTMEPGNKTEDGSSFLQGDNSAKEGGGGAPRDFELFLLVTLNFICEPRLNLHNVLRCCDGTSTLFHRQLTPRLRGGKSHYCSPRGLRSHLHEFRTQGTTAKTTVLRLMIKTSEDVTSNRLIMSRWKSVISVWRSERNKWERRFPIFWMNT